MNFFSRALAITFLILCFTTNPSQAQPQLSPEIYINGQQSLIIPGPGEPFVLEVRFYQVINGVKTLFKDFRDMHGKYMHMFVIKKDLFSFNHVHPYYDMHSGTFHITFNLSSSDPDNIGVNPSFELSGQYSLALEVKTQGDFMKKDFLLDINVQGQDRQIPIKLDSKAGENTIIKFFSHSGEPAKEGSYYKTIFKIKETKGCGGNLVKYNLSIFELNSNGAYEPSGGLQPWLGMGGHSLVVKYDSNQKKHDYYHIHAQLPIGSNVYKFDIFNIGQLTEGIYRTWIQIKNLNQVYTLPFSYYYKPEAISARCFTN